MAVSAVFSADFGSFFDAVEQSEIKLRALDAGSQKVESSLNRMANSFSGQKIIQDAAQMAKIFEDAGGKAAFTEKELARMNTTATEAAEKLRAIGQDIPPGIQKLATETKGATEATSAFGASLDAALGSLLAMFSVQAAFSFVSNIVEAAGALEDLSAQTQISIVDLQILGNAMRDFGVSTEELGRGLYALSTRIAKGDDSVADALLAMGLSLQQVRDMHGEELFLTIQDGLATLQGSLRDWAAAELYGNKLGAAMAGAAEKTREAVDAARAANNVISPEATAALDELSEMWDRFTTKVNNWSATKVLGPVAAEFNLLFDAIDRGQASTIDWGKWWGDLAKNLMSFNTEAARGQLDSLLGKTKELGAEFLLIDGQPLKFLGPEFMIPATKGMEDYAGATKKAREEAERIAAVSKEIAKEFEVKVRQERDAAQAAADKVQAEEDEWTATQKHIQALRDLNAMRDKQAAEAAALAAEEKMLEDQYQATVPVLKDVADAHTVVGEAAAAGTQIAVAGYQQMGQQAALTLDNVRALAVLMRDEAAANAILHETWSWTQWGGPSRSQYERLAALPLPPGFQSGVTNFSGGLARVHQDELLVNLPSGTSVIPKGSGGGTTVYNTFHLVDTESNLARRVSETILRTVRAGTQLGTT